MAKTIKALAVPDREKRVTLTDVSSAAGVDGSVVSRVLSGDPRLKIRHETRERVLKVVQELGYRPNALARSLRTAKAGAYGLILPDFENPVYAAIIKGAEEEAAQRGHLLLAGGSGGSGAVDNQLELLAYGRVDGLLLAGADVSDTVAAVLASSRLPWLRLNRRSRGSSRFVILDDEGAAGLAVRHLADLGHTRIAHLAGRSTADTAVRRQTGYVRAMKALGFPVPEGYVVQSDYTAAGGAEAFATLMSLDPRPTAIVVANVASAIGALYCARKTKVAVPWDVSVVAIHDLPLAGFLSPPLTTVRMPLEQLGRRGIELLSTVPAGEDIKEVLAGPMELVVRESTARPR